MLKPFILGALAAAGFVMAANASESYSWYRTNQDAVACLLYGQGVSGCVEVRAGSLMRVVTVDGQKSSMQLGKKVTVVVYPNGRYLNILSDTIAWNKELSCNVKKVLLHYEVSCDG